MKIASLVLAAAPVMGLKMYNGLTPEAAAALQQQLHQQNQHAGQNQQQFVQQFVHQNQAHAVAAVYGQPAPPPPVQHNLQQTSSANSSEPILQRHNLCSRNS